LPAECVALIDRIIEERKAQGMTQKDLAKASGLTQSVIARIESKASRPQIDTLCKLLAALGCELSITKVS